MKIIQVFIEIKNKNEIRKGEGKKERAGMSYCRMNRRCDWKEKDRRGEKRHGDAEFEWNGKETLKNG